MTALEFRLLGKFEATMDGAPIRALDPPSKMQELASYLLLSRNRPRRRDAIADALWSDSHPSARKSLRQTLWQLQSVLAGAGGRAEPFLAIDPEWIAVNPDADVHADIDDLEEAFDAVRRKRSEEIDEGQAVALDAAAAAYRGELLEGCFGEWCLFERERLKSLYLALLDRLLGYCEYHHESDAGIVYGRLILRYDNAHERTHWRMMRLQFLAGDRTAAIRQFRICAAALDKELGIQPGELTTRLYDDVCADRAIGSAGQDSSVRPLHVGRVLSHMRQVKRTLAYTESLVAQDIAEIEAVAHTPQPSQGPSVF